MPDDLSEQRMFSKSMQVMSLLGVGAIFGTVSIGWVYDKLGHRAACI